MVTKCVTSIGILRVQRSEYTNPNDVLASLYTGLPTLDGDKLKAMSSNGPTIDLRCADNPSRLNITFSLADRHVNAPASHPAQGPALPRLILTEFLCHFVKRYAFGQLRECLIESAPLLAQDVSDFDRARSLKLSIAVALSRFVLVARRACT
jgi:hypothetical protein